MSKKYIFILSLLLVVVLGLSLAPVLAKNENIPANDIERGVFVHYPHANAQAKGAGATGDLVNDFKYSGIHWAGPNPAVSYWINPTGTSSDSTPTP